MKRLLLLFISAFSLTAATTTVTQPVVGPDGHPASGRVSIQISQACRSGANYVGMKPIPVTVTGGVFSVALVPNDTCVPSGTSYSVTWQLTGGNGWTETWLVPTSGTPVTVDSVVAETAPPSSFVIQWTQMGQNGASFGQSMLWNGSSWLPGTVVGATGPQGPQGPTGPAGGGLGYTAENIANKGAASGYAALDASENVLGAGFLGSGSGGGALMMTQGSAQTPPANTIGLQAPPSVPTSFNCTWWGVPAAGLIHATNTTPCILSPSLIVASDLDPSLPTVDTSGSYTDLLNLPTIPGASIVTPSVDGTGAVGVSGAFARADHVHPTDTSRQAALGFTPVNVTSKGAANGIAPLDANALLPIANLPNPIVTAGAGGVTANYLVARDTVSNPTRYVATGSGGCGTGFAASTAVSGATFQLYAMPGTMIAAVADNTVTAGDVLIGGSATPGRVADAGVTSRASVLSTVCIVGIAQSSAVAGGAVTVLFDGTGSYGTSVSSASVVAGLGYTPENPASLAAVATSGSYTDLSNKPTIPAASSTTPVMDGTGAVGTASTYAKADHVHPTDTSRAPLASPALTGAPTAPTQTAGDNSTDLATDAFVQAALPVPATVAPLQDGVAAVGTSLLYARQDHVHPTDTSRGGAANVQTAATVGVYSDCACAHAGDTSISGVTCDNATLDAVGANAVNFTKVYSLAANSVQANTSWKIYSALSYFSGLAPPTTEFYLQYAGTSIYTPNSFVTGSASNPGYGGSAQFHLIGVSTTAIIVEEDFVNLAAGIFNVEHNSLAQPQTVATNTTKSIQPTLKFGTSTGVASGTYTSGGSITGTVGQTCLLSAFNGTVGTAAAGSVALTGSNTIAGGTALVITNTGSGYTGLSTTATLGSGTATCSGTATIVTVLGGAQGNAVCQLALLVTPE